MHRNVEFNKTAQATFDALGPRGQHQIREICVMLEDFWEVLLAAKYLRPRTFWGVEAYVYRDDQRPYVLVMQLVDRGKDVQILLIVPASFHPRQVRV